MSEIEAVVFDVGETLVREERSWTEWANWLDIEPPVLFAAFGAAIAAGHDHREAFQLIHPGFDFESQRMAKESAGFKWRLEASDLYPDAEPCIRELKAQGFRIGIAGNQPTAIESMLNALGLPVDFISSSESWGVAKPSSEFFERVVDAAEVSRDRVAYVGDRLDNDVLPARDAGMFSIFIRRGPWGFIQSTWPEVELAHARVESLREVITVVTAR